MVFEIAVYGKGGIGKSTISANLSYSLAKKGRKVIQIGCDPKSDSSRLLLKGRRPTTVLDMIRDKRSRESTLEDLVHHGTEGVLCLEAGGPEPGIGCAGKGILTMFQTIEKMGIGEYESDIVVYDVLGDVVCGGFAIPMRPDYSDAVVIVTSGEFMSLYAANNIMKGLMNFEKDKPRLAGLIFNSRGSEKEDELVKEFSRATMVPILVRIPRSELFMAAEKQCGCIGELFPESEEAEIFRQLSDRIIKMDSGGNGLCSPRPLSDGQMEALITSSEVEGFGSYVPSGKGRENSDRAYPKCPVFTPVKRIGMGPIGAAITAGKLTDVPVVIHGSRSCGYSMLNEVYEQRLAHLRNNPECRVGNGDNLFCSEIGTAESIFGGSDNLEALLEGLAPEHRMIIVVMTCLTNMIGDDCRTVIENVKRRHPGIRIPVIGANEAVIGTDAHMEVLKAITDLIDTTKKSDGETVRMIDDNFIEVDKGCNRDILQTMMSPFGKKVGAGFLEDCTLQDVIDLKTTDIAFISEPSADNNTLADLLRSKGVRVAMRPLPKGHREGCEWIEHIGKMFSNRPAAEYLLRRFGKEFDDAVADASIVLAGKRIAILDDRSESIHWLEEALDRAGTGELTVYSMGAEAPERYIAPVRHHSNHRETIEDILSDRPDLVIGNLYSMRGLEELICEEFPSTTLGTPASVMFLKRVSDILSVKKTESWRKWGEPLE